MCEKGGDMDLVCGPGTDGGGKYLGISYRHSHETCPAPIARDADRAGVPFKSLFNDPSSEIKIGKCVLTYSKTS